MPKRPRTSKQYKYKRRSGAWGGYGKYYRTSKPSPLRYLKSLPVGGVPKVSYKKLRHCEEITMDSSSGSYTKLDFYPTVATQLTANSQNPVRPGNWSTVADGVYRKCVVVAAKVTFRWVSSRNQNDNGSAQPSYIGMYLSNGEEDSSIDDIMTNGVANLMEQPRNITMKAVPYGDNSQQKDCVISRSIVPHKFFGVERKHYEDNQTYASEWSATNEVWQGPEEAILLQLFTSNIQGNNPHRIEGIITIDLICKFTQPHYTRAR